jgi:hypothetical protein
MDEDEEEDLPSQCFGTAGEGEGRVRLGSVCGYFLV